MRIRRELLRSLFGYRKPFAAFIADRLLSPRVGWFVAIGRTISAGRARDALPISRQQVGADESCRRTIRALADRSQTTRVVEQRRREPPEKDRRKELRGGAPAECEGIACKKISCEGSWPFSLGSSSSASRPAREAPNLWPEPVTSIPREGRVISLGAGRDQLLHRSG